MQPSHMECYSEMSPILVPLLDKVIVIRESSLGSIELKVVEKINQEAKSTDYSEVLEIQLEMFKNYEIHISLKLQKKMSCTISTSAMIWTYRR